MAGLPHFQICWYYQQNIYPQFICKHFIEITTGKHISVLSSICFEHKLGLTVWLPLNHRYRSSLCDFGCFTRAAVQNPKHNVENPRICSKSEPTSGLWLIRSLECQLSIPQTGPTHIVVIVGIPYEEQLVLRNRKIRRMTQTTLVCLNHCL